MTVPPRDGPLTVTEEILLLLLDDDGKFVPVQQERLTRVPGAGGRVRDIVFLPCA